MSRCVSVSPRSCHTTSPIWNLALEVLTIFIQMACDYGFGNASGNKIRFWWEATRATGRRVVPLPLNALGFGNDACVSRGITKGSIQ